MIDNYVDESVLTILSKRKKNVSATVFSSQITKQLKLDLQKHNLQYATIELFEFSKSHDRFLIIDEVVYRFGASLKYLGEKWFAFSKMEMHSEEVLFKIKGISNNLDRAPLNHITLKQFVIKTSINPKHIIFGDFVFRK